VSGVISSGGSHDEFMEPTQDLSAAISGATRAVSGNYECLGVLLVLSKARERSAMASTTGWNGCAATRF
jgi:hypothetical protein